MLWNATVEKVAINAVMAGCRPEYFPIVLAIATSGVDTGTTHGWHITVGVVSGTNRMSSQGHPFAIRLYSEKGENRYLRVGWA